MALLSRSHRERRTIKAMIGIYCHGRHQRSAGLCGECRQLLAYAMERIDKCGLGQKKPTCAKCSIHCYKPDMREQVRSVMRYAGPRMIWRHPLLAIMHYIDEVLYARIKTPAARGKAKQRGRNREEAEKNNRS
jgi:hypothetical protein